jgi:hypothetical protein
MKKPDTDGRRPRRLQKRPKHHRSPLSAILYLDPLVM